MEKLFLNLAALLFACIVIGIFYILSHHDLRAEVWAYIKLAWAGLLEMFSFPKSYKDSDIRDFIKESFAIRVKLLTATSHAELETAYWDIDTMEDDFRGLVPPLLLETHVNTLFEMYSDRRSKFFQSIKV